MSAQAKLAEQRRRAAKKGTEVRSRRAALKAEIASGDADLAELLRGTVTPGDDVAVEREILAEEIRVGELVRAVPGIGPMTASDLLEAVSIDGSRPLCEVSTEKRAALAAALTENGEE